MCRTTKNDITGQRFGRLVALKFMPDDNRWPAFWFRCDCGKEKRILAQAVFSGATVSCGCYSAQETTKRQATHGQSGKKRSGAYSSWANMMDRCEWGGHKKAYSLYGAVGIRVHPSWHNFEVFFADMGDRPKGCSIDRIDNSKGYEPGNCRWATRLEQSLNRKNTCKVLFNGETTPVYIICEQFGLSKQAIRVKAYRNKGDYVAALKSVGIDCEAAN